MKERKTEVLVAGAGPAGLLTAILLAENGVEVQIIDREERTASRSYACALHPRTLRLLHRLGLVEELLARGRRVESIARNEQPLAAMLARCIRGHCACSTGSDSSKSFLPAAGVWNRSLFTMELRDAPRSQWNLLEENFHFSWCFRRARLKNCWKSGFFRKAKRKCSGTIDWMGSKMMTRRWSPPSRSSAEPRRVTSCPIGKRLCKSGSQFGRNSSSGLTVIIRSFENGWESNMNLLARLSHLLLASSHPVPKWMTNCASCWMKPQRTSCGPFPAMHVDGHFN